MITFGYRGRFDGLIRALVAIAVGIVMVLARGEAMNFVVKIIAAFVLASGVVSLAVGIKRRQDNTFSLMMFNSIMDILIAVLLFVFDDFAANLVFYLIGAVLLLLGIFQIIALISADRVLPVGFVSFVLPALVTALGVFLLVNPEFAKDWISMLAGAALVVYGASELLSSWKMRKAMETESVDDQGTV